MTDIVNETNERMVIYRYSLEECYSIYSKMLMVVISVLLLLKVYNSLRLLYISYRIILHRYLLFKYNSLLLVLKILTVIDLLLKLN
jgi:hypothetical protein